MCWYKTLASGRSWISLSCLWSCSQQKKQKKGKKRILQSPLWVHPTRLEKQVSIHHPHPHPPATFAHWPHSSPETQYLTTDKQLTHLFFWGTRWLAPSSSLAALTAREPAEIKGDNLIVKPQIAIKLLYFTIRKSDSWPTAIPTLCILLSNCGNCWNTPR